VTNPFDLAGPPFLIFYALFGTLTLAVMLLARHLREAGPLPDLDLKDPYLFACLNRGPMEVVRVAVMGLLDRGLLRLSGQDLKAVPEHRLDFGQPRIEKDVLAYFRTPSPFDPGQRHAHAFSAAPTEYEDLLRRLGLLPDASAREFRLACIALALVLLLGVGGLKLLLAIERGHSNVAFLIIMMVVFTVIAIVIGNPYRTALGDKYLASIRTLFSGLRGRRASLQPGTGSTEVLWLVSLFGAAALPASQFAYADRIWPKSSSSSDGGSSCGSSGGCGGGGGGCGGCGS
jgi:uncharacterized protein (TIGR04222 family)